MKSASIALLSLSLASSALAQLRVGCWNVTNYGSGRVAEFQTSIYGTVPATLPGGAPLALAGQRFAPDVILLQEITSASGVTNFVNLLNSAPGSPGDWAGTTWIDGPPGDTSNSLVYRTSKLVLVQNTTIISAGAVDTDGVAPHIPPRNTERWILRLAGYTDIPANRIAMYSSHMKSGSGVDELRRGTEATRIAADVQALPVGMHAVVGGDFNVTGYTDDGFAPMVGAVNGQPSVQNGPLYDPIRALGGWENSSTFRFIHTQDPGAGQQMDSRFDFILIGASLRDGQGLDYIGSLTSSWNLSTFADPAHSYRCWGNDGSSFNTSMNVASNAMVGPVIAQALQSSAAGLGHLPVFLDLRVPAQAQLSTATLDFGDVPQGSAQSRTFMVSNSANTGLWTAAGIANLNYTNGAPTGTAFTLVGAGTPQIDAPGGSGNTHTVNLSTATPGLFTSTVTIITSAPDTPTLTLNLRANITQVACGPSDIASPGQVPQPDGQLTADDIIRFVNNYFARFPLADIAGPGQVPGADGEFTADDLILFVNRFFTGC